VEVDGIAEALAVAEVSHLTPDPLDPAVDALGERMGESARVADLTGAVGWDWQVTPPGDLWRRRRPKCISGCYGLAAGDGIQVEGSVRQLAIGGADTHAAWLTTIDCGREEFVRAALLLRA